jgi:hypothetical protein
MISRKTFWLTTALLVAVGLLTGVGVADHLVHRPVHYAEAAWAQIFDSPRALTRSVDTIVLAQALETRPGRVATSANGEDTLPFQVTEFEVVHGIKGAADYDHVFVERAGGTAPDGRSVVIDADGGAFEPGSIYLLFLQPQKDGDYYYQVNDQGRFQVVGDHLMAVRPDNPVASAFHGETIERAVARVEALAAGPQGREPFKK